MNTLHHTLLLHYLTHWCRGRRCRTPSDGLMVIQSPSVEKKACAGREGIGQQARRQEKRKNREGQQGMSHCLRPEIVTSWCARGFHELHQRRGYIKFNSVEYITADRCKWSSKTDRRTSSFFICFGITVLIVAVSIELSNWSIHITVVSRLFAIQQ